MAGAMRRGPDDRVRRRAQPARRKPAAPAGRHGAKRQAPGKRGRPTTTTSSASSARENNLEGAGLEIPKRCLTALTGVSGSGESSLAFRTIAAESKRLINATYSAVAQGFMATVPRPEVDALEGLTTAIVVDQRRLGADPRSTVAPRPTPRDAPDPVGRLGKPHVGPPTRSRSTSLPSKPATRSPWRPARTVKRSFSRLGGMCPRGEGRATSPTSSCHSSTTTRSPSTGVRPASRATTGVVGTSARTARRASSTPTSRSADLPARSCTTSPTASQRG